MTHFIQRRGLTNKHITISIIGKTYLSQLSNFKEGTSRYLGREKGGLRMANAGGLIKAPEIPLLLSM